MSSWSRNRRASRSPSLPIWVRLCWLSAMPLATAPRYQDRMPARSASLRLAWPAPRAAVAVAVEAVQPGQVTQPVRAAPGVQRVGEVLIPLVAVADDGARIAGEDPAG